MFLADYHFDYHYHYHDFYSIALEWGGAVAIIITSITVFLTNSNQNLFKFPELNEFESK